MSLKSKLNRFKTHINTEAEKTVKSDSKTKGTSMLEVPFLEEWKEFGVSPFYYEDQFVLVREVEYSLDYEHGLYPLGEFKNVISDWKESSMNHPLSSQDSSFSDLFFFDTETTGLGGGVGNTIFLLGYAQVLPDKVKIKQHFLPNVGNEVALYQSFLSDIDFSKLVSYNGKAFDWPQVKTRYTLIRDAVPKLPAFGHFDLLHAARRLWKDSLPNVRLSTVEKDILNIKREHDVPGYLAPMIYFDYLKDPNPEGMKGVITHNEIDVLTLITLYTHISKLLLDRNLNLHTSIESYEIARWYESLGHKDHAGELYYKISRKDTKGRIDAKKALGYLYKKQKRYHEAVYEWEECINDWVNSDEEIAIELSKVYEHQLKDVEKALFYAEKATLISKNKKRVLNQFIKPIDDFQKRINRLQQKMKR